MIAVDMVLSMFRGAVDEFMVLVQEQVLSCLAPYIKASRPQQCRMHSVNAHCAPGTRVIRKHIHTWTFVKLADRIYS